MSISSECSEDTVTGTKSRILALICELDDSERGAIEQWISSSEYRRDLQKLKSYQKEENELAKIAAKLRKEMGLNAVMPTEKIMFPTIGDLGDCTKINTCHLDEFLYDDEEFEKLVQEGKISRHYCVSCGSRDVKELEVISHSQSRSSLLFIFKVLLPKDLSGMQILDVGSRLGAVLYGAHYFSNVSKIIGVEMNKELCDLQERTITHFNLESKIKIINSDIMNAEAVIQSSNIIVINVLDFFVEPSKQIEMWKFFKSNIKKGTLVVTSRSISETLTSLGIYEDFLEWLRNTGLCQMENEMLFNVVEYNDIHLYRVE